jgi:hypothetical protein
MCKLAYLPAPNVASPSVANSRQNFSASLVEKIGHCAIKFGDSRMKSFGIFAGKAKQKIWAHNFRYAHFFKLCGRIFG